MIKKRKTRVTKAFVHQLQEEKKNAPKAKKNLIVPGPWTNTDTQLKVKPEIRVTQGIIGPLYGAYTKTEFWHEKGWYPIILNITSKKIKKDVEKHGLDAYIAAWEKAINIPENKDKYGTIVILKASVDHSLDEDETRRFISCEAKTNKKSIKGFSAVRKGKYVIL